MVFRTHCRILMLFGAFLLALPALPAQIERRAPGLDEFFDPDRNQGIAAKVEDQIITVEEVRREMAPLINQIYRRSGSEEEFNQNLDRLQLEVLQNLIDRILIVREFRAQEMTIPKSYLESEFNEAIQRDFNGERERFLAYLRSRDQTVREFRQELEETIILQIMRQRMRRTQAEVSPERIEEYYRNNQDEFQREAEVRIRQITVEAENEEALESKTEEILRELGNGADFAELARTESSDSFAARGGMAGWIKRNSLRPEIEKEVFNLGVGEYSDPIPLGNIVLIYYVVDKRDAGARPIDEVRDEIEKTLTDQIARRAQERWLKRLRGKALVEYYL